MNVGTGAAALVVAFGSVMMTSQRLVVDQTCARVCILNFAFLCL